MTGSRSEISLAWRFVFCLAEFDIALRLCHLFSEFRRSFGSLQLVVTLRPLYTSISSGTVGFMVDIAIVVARLCPVHHFLQHLPEG